MTVRYETRDRVAVVTIDRPHRRNAVDRATAEALLAAWQRFEVDEDADVGVLYGMGGVFSAGADLKTFDLVDRPEGYLGFTRTEASKPTIAAVEGHCVGGGLEMALWCDLRVAGRSAVFGCFERRLGVPLVDGGTQRLPRVVGRGLAMEMILTGRPVEASEAFGLGLVNQVVEDGEALRAALELARRIAGFPQETLRSDRLALLEGADLPLADGLEVERRRGQGVLAQALRGAALFAGGAGRSGRPVAAGDATAPSAGAPTTDLEVDGRIVPLHVVTPGAGTGPAVLVIHDRWGLDSAVRDAVDRLARAGFVTAAVGVLEPAGPGSDDVAERVRRLDPGHVGRVLVAAVRMVSDLPGASGGTGVVGLGMGGGLAMWLATTEKDVEACAAFTPTSPWIGLQPTFEGTGAAFLGHYGALDPTASPHTADQLELQLRTMGIDATFEIYPDVGHEFYRAADRDSERATQLAWDRTIGFLRRVIA